MPIRRMFAVWGLLLAMTVSGGTLLAGEPLTRPSSRPHAKWVNALAPKGTVGPKLTLANEGKTDYVILIPAVPVPKSGQPALNWPAG